MTKEELLRSFRPVTLEDRPLFNRYLAGHPPTVSELTFTNAFCWAEARHHLVADLRDLKGKQYHGKRNFSQRFAEQYHPEVRPLSASLAAQCMHVQEAWLEGQRHNETARDESTALIKALRHFDDLGLSGVAVF